MSGARRGRATGPGAPSPALAQARLREALDEAFRTFRRDPRRLIPGQRPAALQAWEAQRKEAFAEFEKALEAQNSNQEV